MAEEFLVTRQKAAKIIGVSTRTIDRYISQEKFSVVREDGKVLLDSRELKEYKNGKNPIVAQVVQHTNETKENNISIPLASDEGRNQILYEEIKSHMENKECLLREMHYKLGVLETESKNLQGTTIPLLESENEKQELSSQIEDISTENKKLKSILKSARNGRVFFFILSLVFLILILLIFVIQKGNLFMV